MSKKIMENLAYVRISVVCEPCCQPGWRTETSHTSLLVSCFDQLVHYCCYDCCGVRNVQTRVVVRRMLLQS